MDLEDDQIIRLFFERSEAAVAELYRKYGGLCMSISCNILKNREAMCTGFPGKSYAGIL